jgi:hypothetical protein
MVGRGAHKPGEGGDLLSLKRLAVAVGVVVAAAWGVASQAALPDVPGGAHWWTHEFPDTDGFGGKKSSLAFDSEGNPYISYWYALAGGFRVAYRLGETWYVDDVEETDG